MINFQIYKYGILAKFSKNYKNFKIEEFETLFIFHGLYGRGKNWQSFAKKMSQKENLIVITVDLRNHGGNIFKKNMSYHLMIKDVLEIFSFLKIRRTNLLGHSMGGKLAMLIALFKPNYVNKVIIGDIAPTNYDNFNYDIIDAMYKLDLGFVRNRNHADELLSNHIDQQFLRSFLLQNLELVDGKYKWTINLTAIKKSIHDLQSFPKIENNKRVDTKLLCIFGQKSNYVRRDHLNIFKNYFSNISFHEIKNAGHFLHIENPNEFYEVSKNFFKE